MAEDRICSGRTEGSRRVVGGSCDPQGALQEACRGSQLADLPGTHRVDVPAGAEEGGSWLVQAGSYQAEGSRQGSQWLVGNLREH